MSNQQIVLDFIKTVCSNNKDAILAAFSADAIFHNMPMEPAQGHEAIWEVFAMIHDICGDIKWEVHNITEGEDGKVYTERSDFYQVHGKWIEFQCMGIFELENGKITHWRDYFDLAKGSSQMELVLA
jgi:limonene-1,2-epoxide hydrolase